MLDKNHNMNHNICLNLKINYISLLFINFIQSTRVKDFDLTQITEPPNSTTEKFKCQLERVDFEGILTQNTNLKVSKSSLLKYKIFIKF